MRTNPAIVGIEGVGLTKPNPPETQRCILVLPYLGYTLHDYLKPGGELHCSRLRPPPSASVRSPPRLRLDAFLFFILPAIIGICLGQHSLMTRRRADIGIEAVLYDVKAENICIRIKDFGPRAWNLQYMEIVLIDADGVM